MVKVNLRFFVLNEPESRYIALEQQRGVFFGGGGGEQRRALKPIKNTKRQTEGVVIGADRGIYSRHHLKPPPGLSTSWQTTKERLFPPLSFHIHHTSHPPCADNAAL